MHSSSCLYGLLSVQYDVIVTCVIAGLSCVRLVLRILIYAVKSFLQLHKKKKFHGSRETRLEAEFSASAVGTPPPSRIKGADAAPKRWEVSK